MSHADPHRHWTAPWQRGVRPAATPDPADLGTAFGLDLSLSATAEPPPAPVPVRARGWWSRLAARRRAAR